MSSDRVNQSTLPVTIVHDDTRRLGEIFAGFFLAIVASIGATVGYLALQHSNLLTSAPLWQRQVLVFGTPSAILVAGVGMGYLVGRAKREQIRSRFHTLSELSPVLNGLERNPKRRFFYANGLGVTESIFRNTFNWLANVIHIDPRFEKDEIWGIYNADHGASQVIEAVCNMRGHVSRPSELMYQGLLEAFDEMDNDGRIALVCHSQGTAHTLNALRALEQHDPELVKRIDVLALGVLSFIDKDLCGSVVHVSLTGDWVSSVPGNRRNASDDQGTIHEEVGSQGEHGLDNMVWFTPTQEWIASLDKSETDL